MLFVQGDQPLSLFRLPRLTCGFERQLLLLGRLLGESLDGFQAGEPLSPQLRGFQSSATDTASPTAHQSSPPRRIARLRMPGKAAFGEGCRAAFLILHFQAGNFSRYAT